MTEFCPNCSSSIPPDPRGIFSCPSCGVIFSRLPDDPPPQKAMQRLTTSSSESSRPPGLLPGVLFCAALIGVFLLGRSSQQPAPVSPEPEPEVLEAAVEADATELAEEAPPGLSAAALLSQPDLESWGEIPEDREPIQLTGIQMKEIRDAIEEVALSEAEIHEAGRDAEGSEGTFRFEVEPMDATGSESELVESLVDGPRPQNEPEETLRFVGWYSGASGYEQGRRQAQRMGRPMVVYFHTDWCPYCRAFDTSYLTDPLVRRFLSNVVRIHVNPEDGDIEMALAQRYGVAGYPSFFILPHGLAVEDARRVHPFRNNKEIPVEQFVAECEDATELR